MLFERLKNLLSRSGPENAGKPGMITRTCRECGKTFTIPENVQYWPDYCQECRSKVSAQMITRKCKGCGEEFSFPSTAKRWPKYCPDCQIKRKKRN